MLRDTRTGGQAPAGWAQRRLGHSGRPVAGGNGRALSESETRLWWAGGSGTSKPRKRLMLSVRSVGSTAAKPRRSPSAPARCGYALQTAVTWLAELGACC